MEGRAATRERLRAGAALTNMVPAMEPSLWTRDMHARPAQGDLCSEDFPHGCIPGWFLRSPDCSPGPMHAPKRHAPARSTAEASSSLYLKKMGDQAKFSRSWVLYRPRGTLPPPAWPTRQEA